MIKLICDACGQEIENSSLLRKLNITNTNGAVTRSCGKGILTDEHTISAADLCFDCADKFIAIISEKSFAPTSEDSGEDNTGDNTGDNSGDNSGDNTGDNTGENTNPDTPSDPDNPEDPTNTNTDDPDNTNTDDQNGNG